MDAPEGGFDAIMQAIACKVCQIYIQSNANCGYQHLHRAHDEAMPSLVLNVTEWLIIGDCLT